MYIMYIKQARSVAIIARLAISGMRGMQVGIACIAHSYLGILEVGVTWCVHVGGTESERGGRCAWELELSVSRYVF